VTGRGGFVVRSPVAVSIVTIGGGVAAASRTWEFGEIGRSLISTFRASA